MSPLRSGVDQSKSKTDTSLGVYINEGEMYKIQEWVLKHKNIETGRDLWPSDGDHYLVFGSMITQLLFSSYLHLGRNVEAYEASMAYATLSQ